MQSPTIWSVGFLVVASGCGWGSGTVPVQIEGTRPVNTADRQQTTIPATEKEISFDLGGGVKLELVLIPAGEFLMGSPDAEEHALDSEKPRHQVRISKPFYLGRYEVTQEQWEAVMGSNPSHFKGAKNPVEQVSWDDCQAFLSKLNANFAGGDGRFVLPTEAQWEYACRAGSTTRYGFGDDKSGLGEYAWYAGNTGDKMHSAHGKVGPMDSQTHAVGQKKPNPWGLYDMHGNVWEWCADRYDKSYYANSPADDPTGPVAGSGRVHRGGSWLDWAVSCRSAVRYGGTPGFRFDDMGFRACFVPVH